LVYKFDHQYVYTTSVAAAFGTNVIYNPATSNFYDQYCFMAGITSFVYDYITAPSFTFSFPTMTLSSRHSIPPLPTIPPYYSMNITTLNLMV
jgi:hypothetical protein